MINFEVLPHHSPEEWISNGYLWSEYYCPVKGCGLPIVKYYWPNDPAYHVDPVTHQAHVTVCGNPERVAAMIRAMDAKSKPAADGKSAAAGEKR
jgi:hypothetical protein